MLVKFQKESDWFSKSLSFLPLSCFIGLWILLMGKMGGGAGRGSPGIFNIGKSKLLYLIKEQRSISFADVAGLDEAK
jgi:cell division protease FtsH